MTGRAFSFSELRESGVCVPSLEDIQQTLIITSHAKERFHLRSRGQEGLENILCSLSAETSSIDRRRPWWIWENDDHVAYYWTFEYADIDSPDEGCVLLKHDREQTDNYIAVTFLSRNYHERANYTSKELLQKTKYEQSDWVRFSRVTGISAADSQAEARKGAVMRERPSWVDPEIAGFCWLVADQWCICIKQITDQHPRPFAFGAIFSRQAEEERIRAKKRKLSAKRYSRRMKKRPGLKKRRK